MTFGTALVSFGVGEVLEDKAWKLLRQEVWVV